MKKFKYIFAAFFMILIACEEDDSLDTVALSNLTVNPEVNQDLPGQVIFRTSASGAKLFKYDFGDGTTGESLSGYIVKTYSEPGQNSYTVTITVTGDDGTTLTETVQVSVDVPATNSDFVNMLTNASSKTWYLAASEPGHLGVGPSKEGIDGDFWYPKWYAATAFEKCGSEESDCLCDDELTFTVDSAGEVSYELDNMGQTYFNVAHLGAVGGTGESDLCFDYDSSGSIAVEISMISSILPEGESLGMQLALSDGGFMGYYVGSSTYEVLALSNDLLYVRTIDALDSNLAWYHKFASAPATPPTPGNDMEPSAAAMTPAVDEANVISLFSDAYTDVAVDTWKTEWSQATLEDVEVAGDAVKKYSELNFVGIETVSTQIDATTMTHFHTDIWTADATEVRIKLVDFGADGAFDGGDDTEHEIAITGPAQGEWVSIDIPLSDFTGLTTKANISQLIYSGDTAGAITVYVDNVYFYDAGTTAPTVPTVAAMTPTVDEADVISMFSNAYTNVVVDTWKTEWSQADLEDVMVEGDDVKKYSALNFVGVETVANQIDATTMTHFHTDIWTADATEVRIKLVDFGPDGMFDGGDDVEHEIAITNPNPGEWISLDIPMTDFTNLTTSANIAQLIYSGDPSGGITVFVDNVYFHK